MQIPFMHAVARGSVGVITANAERLTPRHFAASGIPNTIPVVLAGMEDQIEFREAILEEKERLIQPLSNAKFAKLPKSWFAIIRKCARSCSNAAICHPMPMPCRR